MAWTPNGANAEALAGIQHLANAGHANENTISPLSLQADSDRWNSLTPHAVVSTAPSEQSSDAQ
jgi:hypothetical protein